MMHMIPKSIDFPMVKVFKGEEEMFLEQMML
jgi:hypothetical protein